MTGLLRSQIACALTFAIMGCVAPHVLVNGLLSETTPRTALPMWWSDMSLPENQQK